MPANQGSNESLRPAATVHITKIVNGRQTTRHLCANHAAEEGLMPVALYLEVPV